MVRKENLGKDVRAASFKPGTFNEERNTIDVVFSSGAQVKRQSFFEGDFIEELSLKRKDVRLDRLNSGAPVLSNHDSYRLDSVLGVVEKASIKKEDGKTLAMATVRFSDREEIKPIIKDIRDGILPNISVGYRVHKFEEMPKNDDGVPVFRATDWEPYEISFVTIPADAQAQVRSDDEKHACEIVRIEEALNVPEESTVLDSDRDGCTYGDESRSEISNCKSKGVREMPTEETVNLDDVKLAAVNEERKRVSEITTAVRSAGLSEDFKSTLVEGGTSIDEARKLVIEELGKKDAETKTRSSNVAIITEERDTVKRGIEDAILHRTDSRVNKLTDVGREFRGMGLLDMARECLDQAGVKTRGMSRQEVAKLALRAHTSSDFPEILANVAGKTLRDAYEAAPQTFESFTRRVEVPDFKQVSRTQLGDAPDLEEVLESGEISQGTVGEQAEKYEVKTYAKMIGMSRKMLVNDDLSAFARIPQLFGRAAADLESDLVWNILFDNAALADAVALFHATHSNLNQGGLSAITVASLGAARAAMRTQTGLNGRKLNLAPMNLCVPAALETVAQQFIANITPDLAGNVNPFSNRLNLIVEPRIDDNDANSWYLMADAGQVDMIELASLTGETGPMIETEDMFDSEGIKIKARMDRGVKAIDFRGMQKNDGA